MKNDKNWNHANAPGFGDHPDDIMDCYIDDIMKHTANGKYIIFQRTPNLTVDVRVVNNIDGWKFALRPLDPDDIDNPKSELYHCYWNEGVYGIHDGVVMNTFKLHPDPANNDLLIWWDHDLGDVCVDIMGDEIGCHDDKPDDLPIDNVCDGVYLYWIT